MWYLIYMKNDMPGTISKLKNVTATSAPRFPWQPYVSIDGITSVVAVGEALLVIMERWTQRPLTARCNTHNIAIGTKTHAYVICLSQCNSAMNVVFFVCSRFVCIDFIIVFVHISTTFIYSRCISYKTYPNYYSHIFGTGQIKTFALQIKL